MFFVSKLLICRYAMLHSFLFMFYFVCVYFHQNVFFYLYTLTFVTIYEKHFCESELFYLTRKKKPPGFYSIVYVIFTPLKHQLQLGIWGILLITLHL